MVHPPHGFEQGRADPVKVERDLRTLQARLRTHAAGPGDAGLAEVVSEALAALGRARGTPNYTRLIEGDRR